MRTTTGTGTEPEQPYLVLLEGAVRSDYQSMSFHPSKQNMSVERIRLEHYMTSREQSRSYFDDTSKTLMATRQIPSLKMKHTVRTIRAAADGTQKLNGDVIVFLVGTYAPKRYSIHERLVSPRSEFVRLPLRGQWKEAQERTINPPEDDPDVFSVYQQWLYGGLIHTSCDSSFSRTDGAYETLAKAYILGEKFMDHDFKDAATDTIVDKLCSLRRFDTGLTTLVSNNTTSGSPLRRLWMDAYYHFGSPEWLDVDRVGSPINAEFVVDFSRYQMQFRTGFGSSGRDAMFLSCTYHEHGTGPCHRQQLHHIG